MTPLTTVSGRAVVLEEPNIDTDRILPARFLKKPRRPSYAPYLFHDARRRPDGSLDPDFPLNAAEPAVLLVAGRNFACGSSREGAVYALVDAGVRVVVAPSFGDIFASNAAKNGMLALALPEATVAALAGRIAAAPGVPVTFDLAGQTIRAPGGEPIAFEIDAGLKDVLLNGRDDITATLEHEAAIAQSFARMATDTPWLVPPAASQA